jgi:hypothetical protein
VGLKTVRSAAQHIGDVRNACRILIESIMEKFHLESQSVGRILKLILRKSVYKFGIGSTSLNNLQWRTFITVMNTEMRETYQTTKSLLAP